MLIGDATAGKTSLLNGLREYWRPDGSLKPSCEPDPAAVDARTINLERVQLTVGGGVTFSCWDLGGQPEYAAIQQVYLTPRALFVLVVSAAKVRRIIRLAARTVVNGATPQEQEQSTRLANELLDQMLGRWLRYLRFRVPDAVVQPVLTHCDGDIGPANAECAEL